MSPEHGHPDSRSPHGRLRLPPCCVTRSHYVPLPPAPVPPPCWPVSWSRGVLARVVEVERDVLAVLFSSFSVESSCFFCFCCGTPSSSGSSHMVTLQMCGRWSWLTRSCASKEVGCKAPSPSFLPWTSKDTWCTVGEAVPAGSAGGGWGKVQRGMKGGGRRARSDVW